MRVLNLVLTMVWGAAFAVAASAQQPPAAAPAPAASAPVRPGPPADELEPAVDTSASEPAAQAVKPSATPASAAKPVTPTSSARPAAGAGRAQDHLQLETSEITGNRELPKVLYIVPWKRSDLGDLVGKPVNSLLDEVLEPVDRDVFRRENRYYRALQNDSPEVATPAPPK